MSPERTCNSSSWTKEEDKAFENALALYSGVRDQFLKIAASVPGKSIQEIIDYYNMLLEDINDIESGIVPLPKYRRMQSSTVERRKGIPWTLEEHMLFLQGLAKLGRGDWRGISRNFVLSRTPTQVATHAQKFFCRLKDNDNGKRRRSIHDITSAADITEPSHGQKSDEFLRGVEDLITVPAEGTSGARHGVDPRISPSLSLQPPVAGGTKMYTHPVTVLAEGTSGARRGVDTRTSPSHSLQPSVAGGTAMYTYPVNNVWYDLEELMIKQLVGASQVGPTVSTASLPLPIVDHIGSASTMGAPEGGFSVNSMQLPSIPGSSGSGTYPCWNSRSQDDDIFDLEDLFPDHIFGFDK